MTEQQQSLEAIHDIKKMMERSSRFISLSGLSGISAGICALIGAWLAHPYVFGQKDFIIDENAALAQAAVESYTIIFNTWLFWIGIGTFVAALITAFLFTYLKSKKDGTPIWGTTARRLIINVSIPLIVGAIFLLNIMKFGTFGLVAPGCLLFYGLALINASKYTLNELRFLGYAEIILGIISLNFIGYGLYFWAAGFGVLHIIYGVYMWNKYESKKA
jgi:hypothetical protein